MEEKKRGRAVIRGSFTRCANELEGYLSESEPDLDNIKVTWETLQEKLDELKILSSDIFELLLSENVSEKDLATDMDACDMYVKKFKMLNLRCQRIFKDSSSDDGKSSGHNTVRSVGPGGQIGNVSKRSFQLPVIQFKKFDGNIRDWLSFWAQFKKVHEDQSIDSADKVDYLVQATMQGSRARQLVESFPATGENYPKMIESLKARFGREDLQIEVYVRELLKLILGNAVSKNKIELSRLYDQLETQLRSLETLGITSDKYAAMLFPLIESCIPEDLLRIWQRSSVSLCADIQARGYGSDEGDKRDSADVGAHKVTLDKKLKALMHFLQGEVENEQRVSLASEGFGLHDISRNCTAVGGKVKINKSCDISQVPTASGLFNSEPSKCVFCDSTHESVDCFRAQTLSLDKKKELIKSKKGCYRCLKVGHQAKKCRARVKCIVCGKQHVTLLCPDLKVNKGSESLSEPKKSVPVQSQHELNAANYTSSHIFLQTLRGKIMCGGISHEVRILIDTGSQRSYILKSTAQKIGLVSKNREKILHCLFGGVLSEQNHDVYEVQIVMRNGSMCKFDVLDQPQICNDISHIFSGPWIKELRELDIEVNDIVQSGEINLLIGSDVAGRLYTGRRHLLKCGLVAVETVLGWTLMGKVPINSTGRGASASTLCLFVNNATITNLWELDVLGIIDPTEQKTKQELQRATKQYFYETVERESDGRYKVRLPWIEGHPPLPSNYVIARSRLGNVLRKLHSQTMIEAYDQVFKTWLEEGIIELVADNSFDKPGHYLPHRPVLKENSTTKIRPVFDAGAKEKDKPSLNQCLEKGVNLIEEIPNILMRFRENKIGVVSDIRKAFLQVSLQESDRDSLRFLWIDQENSEIIYRHKRVVFGVNSSPFLLGATIEYHLDQYRKKCEESRGITLLNTLAKLSKSFYVDNCVTSVPDEDTLKTFVLESIEIMADAKFDLRGWERTQFDGSGCNVPVLGLVWNTERDTLSLKDCVKDLEKVKEAVVTKRVILGAAQKLFDPIGLVSPVTVCPKILLQKTWENNLGWDKPVEEDMRGEFLSWVEDLKYLRNIEVPRWIKGEHVDTECSVHVFCDASVKAYACVIFLRVKWEQKVYLYLLASKSRIAPKKKISIPRLELLSATIAARLFDSVQRTIEKEIDCYFWSDSSAVLSWIRRQEEWGTFVGNRVSEIRSLTPVTSWRHIPGVMNPADLPSRGCSAKILLESRWWEGPVWLRQDKEIWPQENHTVDEEEINKERKKKIVTMINTTSDDWHFYYFSKYTKMIRMMAWILRIAHNGHLKNVSSKLRGSLSADELNSAENFVFKVVQSEAFTENDPGLKTLDVFHDETGILRLRSRVSNREDCENFRLPIVLPSKHLVTQKLVLETHEKLCHVGVQGLLSALREKYWILGGRRYIRSVISGCTICRRHKSKPFQIPSPPLPVDRVRAAAAFEISGVDFAGPLYLRTAEKVWVCLFTCAVYRAVHFELVTSLSSSHFMKCLRRFIARRGRPKIIYSDRGTNFIGTENAFKRLDWDAIVENCSIERITWRFNPPTAAWWGGFFERLVGLLKQLLRKMLGRASLDYEDLLTVLCDCESVINSRPLTYQTNDASDMITLTPNMFLRELVDSGVPDCDAVDKTSLIKRIRNIQKLRNDLRKRFRNEYLGQLQLLSKLKPSREITIGEVVLIGNDNDKRLDWPMGRVIELLPGKDGRVRLVRIITSKGQLLRPIQRIFPLELEGTSSKDDVETVIENKYVKDNNSESDNGDGSDLNKSRASESKITRSGRVVRLPRRFADQEK